MEFTIKSEMIHNTLCLLLAVYVLSEQEVVIKVTPEKIIDTFKTMMSSKYLRELTEDFATKTADHLLEEIKKDNSR